MAKTTNITVSGLGGQGVLKVTDILAEVLFRAGYDVKKSEVHGMSQRGGSVSSEVRYGEEVASPMVPEGESDFLIVLEPTQIEADGQAQDAESAEYDDARRAFGENARYRRGTVSRGAESVPAGEAA